ncbi:DNA damage-regulated autophagy modulator protein 1-like isoform X1 [Ornithodoros turicata]|uniref:DNA damage-regulated autophagy modulator protein 1-like isoform X1 n=1 Tax=Ornithodoros turicata TaxID=34597 RepID=UPI003139863B
MVKLVGVSWLPIAFGLTLSGGSLLTMMWAVLRGDVTPYLPFVSDAGTDPPQSGFFSICLYITSVLGLLCVLVRFLTIRSFNGHFSRKLDALNTVAAIIAVLAFFGMAAVAAFPTSLVPPAHAVAANLLFFGIICYEALQTVMSFSMCPNFNGRLIATIRLGITVYSICGVIISILLTELYLTRGKMRITHVSMTLAPVAFLSGIGKHIWYRQERGHDLRQRTPADEGFALLVSASAFEWSLGLSLVLFFFTYIREFKKVALEINTDILVEHMEDEPIFRKSPYMGETTYIGARDT